MARFMELSLVVVVKKRAFVGLPRVLRAYSSSRLEQPAARLPPAVRRIQERGRIDWSVGFAPDRPMEQVKSGTGRSGVPRCRDPQRSGTDAAPLDRPAFESRILDATVYSAGPRAVLSHQLAHSFFEVSIACARVGEAPLAFSLDASANRNLIIGLHPQHAIVGTPLDGLPGSETRRCSSGERQACK